jgi:hypothetical protein
LYALIQDIEDEWVEDERLMLWQVFDRVHHRANNVLHHSAAALSQTIEETKAGQKIADLGSSTMYLNVTLPYIFASYGWLLTLVFEGGTRERLVELIAGHVPAFDATA